MLNAMTMAYNDTKYTIYNIQCNDTKYTGDWRPPHLLPLLAPPPVGQVLTRYSVPGTWYQVHLLLCQDNAVDPPTSGIPGPEF